jgi:hypothetical protein
MHSVKFLILQHFLSFLQLVGLDWIDLAQDRDRWQALAYTGMNLQFSYNEGNFLTSRGTVSFSGKTLFYGVS